MDTGGCSGSEPYALRVLGDSMAPEFEHGAIIIVDPGGVIENGCYVVAQIGEEFIFRQLVMNEGRLQLQALQAGHAVIEAPMEAIKGVVVQKAGRRRADRRHYVSLRGDTEK